MQETPKTKVYVKVDTVFDEWGRMFPHSLVWENGRVYTIDKVTDFRQAAAMKAGGQGDRYTIRVGNRESFLFFERSTNISGRVVGRWFVERRNAE